MKLIPLASGSKGNAYYIGNEKNGFLVDMGLSMKALKERLAQVNLKIEHIRGIFVTHEHRDHCLGLGALLRKHGIPVYGNSRTLEAMRPLLGKVNENLLYDLYDDGLSFEDWEIRWQRTSHDAAESISYTFQNGRDKVGIMTDTGTVRETMMDFLADCQTLVLEANYDPQLLKTGPYPASVKRRIASDYGHLSNKRSAAFLSRFISNTQQHLLLAHLSETNNKPAIVEEVFRKLLAEKNLSNEVQMHICRPRGSAPIEWGGRSST